MSRVFSKLIDEMEESNLQFSKPMSFKKYQESQSNKPLRTAEFISAQKIEDLSPDLKSRGYMVFRLGSRKNEKTTHFALSKLTKPGDWSEYFLIDSELFKDTEPELFLPNVSIRQLFAFDLLSNLTENSLINLAISSGLLASSLRIETSESLAAPASGQGYFTFDFKPKKNSEIRWKHEKGCVEIDALFVGKRSGRETLFVIEAKTSKSFSSLAKYKLIYPLLSLNSRVPKMIPIVPVYLRAIKSVNKQQIDFYIAEFSPLKREAKDVSIDYLEAVRTNHFVLMGFRTELHQNFS